MASWSAAGWALTASPTRSTRSSAPICRCSSPAMRPCTPGTAPTWVCWRRWRRFISRPGCRRSFKGWAGRSPGCIRQAAREPHCPDGVLDADYFIAVARSLVTGTNNYGSLGQSTRVLATLTAISNLQPARVSPLRQQSLGGLLPIPGARSLRNLPRLQRYFRAMMWCGIIDFRFTGSTNDNSLRELSGAVAMHFLLKNSSQFNDWKQMDDVVQMFVGLPDSLNFAQLSDLMSAAGIMSPANLPEPGGIAESADPTDVRPIRRAEHPERLFLLAADPPADQAPALVYRAGAAVRAGCLGHGPLRVRQDYLGRGWHSRL